MPELRVGVIGAGIVGLSHAWMAAERGHTVTVFERSPNASGASIRNFGMIWPIGQPAGDCHSIALRSRERWLQLSRSSNIWANPCGSIHLAHRADEWDVLTEFHARRTTLGYDCSLLSAEETIGLSAAANPERLLGGLYSPSEVAVNPRAAIHQIPTWLAEKFGVCFEFGTMITRVDETNAISSDCRVWSFDRIIVCGGADVAILFPEILKRSRSKKCKLQMFRTMPQPNDWKMGPHLASGLTLRHYKNFEICSSLDRLKRRVAEETPELDRYGIHVMASQTDEGHVILGDSHEYDDAIEPFDKSEIDELILRELRSIIRLPDWTVSQRWHGVYLKHSERPMLALEPNPGVLIRTGLGGAGMTMAFGLAERDWEHWG